MPLLILLALIVSIGVRYEQVYVRLQRALIRLEVADILRPAQQALAPLAPTYPQARRCLSEA